MCSLITSPSDFLAGGCFPRLSSQAVSAPLDVAFIKLVMTASFLG